MHHEIDSLAYRSRLRYVPSEHKLGFAAVLFLLGYVAPIPVQLTIAVWLAIWVVGYAGIPSRTYTKLLAIPLSFWLTSVPALVIGVVGLQDLPALQGDIWGGLPIGNLYFYLSRQGGQQVVTLLVRTLALTSCLYFVLLTVPFIEWVRVLQQVGCPVLITELLSLMYRFIFVLTQTVQELLAAQQSRVGYCNWRTGMRSLGILVGQLLTNTLNNYRQIALGLNSRGFDGTLHALYTRRSKPNLRYAVEAVSGCIFLATMTGWHYIAG
jgi:cobalt/nickel transport system permease protein